MQTYEEQKAFVSKLNVIDDVFFQKMAEDREVAEEILRIILLTISKKPERGRLSCVNLSKIMLQRN